ncbi:MAG TPA: GNAT family N-acetyltransferase [Actinomycetales bacterium]|nr:GNAT family N-acetyltransferase [Actinomycetales bacterium]
MTADTTSILPLGPERRDELVALDHLAFVWTDEPDPEPMTAGLEWDRTFGVQGSSETSLRSIYSVFTLDLVLPAGRGGAATSTVPMAGLTWVGVHPQHRRRGLLTAMIRHHLHGLHESSGEAVSGLHASEAAIYGRFGYGLATAGLRLTLPRRPTLRDVPGSDEVATRFLTADVEQHTDLVADLYARATRRRPGGVLRTRALDQRQVRDSPFQRRGREPMRLVVAERGGQATGYALVRRQVRWDDGVPNGTADVAELAALDGATHHALWTALTDLDFITRTSTPPLAADDPLLAMLVDARTTRPTQGDDLWLRIVDVDRALAARTYAHEVDVVLGVQDDLCPWNARRWRLTGGPDGATCAPTSDPADVTLDVRELGSVYVGGTSLVSLTAAGLAREDRAGAASALSSALRSALEPGTPFMF